MTAPLSGLRVLDLTQYVAGPYCSMLLADLGAEVIKVERPGAGDVYRQQGPDFIGGHSTTFLALNRNKRSLTVNLKDPRGREIILALAADVGVFLENFKPSTAERLGLGYEVLQQANPAIIYCSISGYGQTGPYRDKGSYDLMVQGLGGLMSMTGEPDGGPVKAGLPVFDFGAALLAVVGILSAYVSMQTTGRGQHVDVSLFDCSVSWLTVVAMGYFATGKVPGRMGTASHTFAPYQAYRARDGYITIVGTGGKDSWAELCRVLGMQHLIKDTRFDTNAKRMKALPELSVLIEDVLRTQDVAYWIEKLEAAGLPCGALNTVDQVLRDPQVQARRMVQEIIHPDGGVLPMIGIPIKFSEADDTVQAAPPRLGEHTDSILSGLGYSAHEIAVLRQDGVV